MPHFLDIKKFSTFLRNAEPLISVQDTNRQKNPSKRKTINFTGIKEDKIKQFDKHKPDFSTSHFLGAKR